MTLVADMVRGAGRFRAAVTVNGSEYSGQRLKAFQQGSSGIGLVGNQSITYEGLYRTQPWIHTIVNRLARSMARLPLKVYVNPDEPDARERVREGALYELLRRPEPNVGKNAMVQAIVSNLGIHGNAVGVPVATMPGAEPHSLLFRSALYWRVEYFQNAWWYVFSPGSGQRIVYRPQEVVHIKWWAGGSGMWASSPLEALRTTLMNEDAAQRMTIASFEHGVRPSGLISVEGNIPADELERGREEIKQIYGGVDRTAAIAILTASAKWQPMSHSLVDSELINLRKLNREEAAAVYNMPPPVVGILDRATFSNIQEQHLMEYMDTAQPYTDMIQEAIEVQIIDRNPGMKGQYVEFDFDGILAGDPIKRMDVLVKATGGPVLTPNEARARLNLPPDDSPESDQLRAAANVSVTQDAGSTNGDQSQK